MEVSVWDTYVRKQDNKIMHFDILVPSTMTDEATVIAFGQKYLRTKQVETGRLTASECKFCHIERATDAIIHAIKSDGFFIIEMENCQ